MMDEAGGKLLHPLAIETVLSTAMQFIPMTLDVLLAHSDQRVCPANAAKTVQPLNPNKRLKMPWNTDWNE